MKALPLQMTLVLYLMGILPGDHEVFCFPSQIEKFDFDMAPNSFDDQYSGCVEEMDGRVKGLLRAEIDNTTEYAEIWKEASKRWHEIKGSLPVPEALKDDYAIALLAYTGEKALYRDFNKAVRNAGSSETAYLNSNFKAMHFLVTRAIQVLQSNDNTKCRDVYRGVRNINWMAAPRKEARFGQFASSSLDSSVAQRFGTDTFFTFRTCHGPYLDEITFFPDEQEVLIPPFEKFQVDNFTKTPKGNNIKLSSVGTYSKYNCVLVKGAGLSHFSADVQLPFLLWGFLLIAGALGSPGLL